jgi:hypothetical protein
MACIEQNLQLRHIQAQGTLTLNGVTPVVVNVPGIEATSVVVLTLNTTGPTAVNVGQPWVSAKVVGTSFSVRGITATADDVYNYIVYNQ